VSVVVVLCLTKIGRVLSRPDNEAQTWADWIISVEQPRIVLIVTRERLLADALATVLQPRYSCVFESAVTPAYQRFAAERPALMVVDVASLGQQGLDLIADARMLDAAAAVVAVIGRGSSLFEMTASTQGVTDILRRGDDLQQIADLLEGKETASAEKPVLDKPTTVLVADDDDAVRKFLSRVLTRDGYRVVTAEDGARAIQRLESEQIDLLFLDLQMPRLGGMAVLRWLSEQPSAPRVVVVSALGGYELKMETLKLGAFDYLEKPISVDRLLVTATAAMVLQPERTRAVWKQWVRKGK
jgi:DNA-binding response OmpR family regulator